MAKPDFWDNQEKAKTIIAESNSLKEWVEPLNKISKDISTVNDLIRLAEAEEKRLASAAAQPEPLSRDN